MTNECRISAALLCRSVSPGLDGSNNINGTWEAVVLRPGVEQLPINIYVYVTASTPGDHFIKIGVIGPSRQESAPQRETKITIVRGKFAASAEITFLLDRPQKGTYWINIPLDGKDAARLPLTIHLGEMVAPPSAR